MAFTTSFARDWVQDGIQDMRRIWAPRSGTVTLQVMEALRTMEDELPVLGINTSSFI